MELSVAIVLVIALSFVAIVSLKVFLVYNNTQKEQHHLLHAKQLDQQWIDIQRNVETLKQDVHNWKYKYHALKRNYDIEADEDEYIDEEQDEEGQLSDLVKILYPKLPKSVSKIIDKPQLQEAIIKSATKNPDGLASLIERFTKKDTPNTSQDQVNNYKETYL